MILSPLAGRPLLLAPVMLALAGCGLSDDSSASKDAAGQVLPGTISDAMVPLDTVRSQAPLAPQAAPAGASDEASDAAEASDAPSDAASAGAGDAAGPAAATPSAPAAAAAKPAAE